MFTKYFRNIWVLCIMAAGGLLPAQAQDNTTALHEAIGTDNLHHMIRQEASSMAKAKGLNMVEFEARVGGYLHELGMMAGRTFANNKITPAPANNGSFSQAQQNEIRRKLQVEIPKLLSADNRLIKLLFARNYSDRILSFHSDVTVATNGKLNVAETIVVYNGNGRRSPDIDYATYSEPNNDIQRGIVRDFPTRYLAKDGFWQKVGFKLLGVTNNGQKTNYMSMGIDNGVRVMIGDEDVLLDEGIYTYEFIYETDRQLIYHSDKDELYWNVNGTGWVFTADSVSCHIHFPEGADIFENACYTGFMGDTEKACISKLTSPNSILFWTTRNLDSWQGLTVAAAIPKAILTAESPRNAAGILKENYGISILLGLLIFLTLFYSYFWYKKGRDPKKGTIFPQFEPPADLTPPDVGFIAEQKYGSHLFAAALVDLAVKKLLTIEVKEKRLIIKVPVYHFEKPKALQGKTVPRTKNLYGFDVENLYGEKAERGEYNSKLKQKYDALQGQLKNRFQVRRGRENTWHGLFLRNEGYTGFGSFLIFCAFIFSVFYTINYYSLNTLAVMMLLMVCLITLNTVFVRIMSAYTEKGRQIADHIEGFKMYLETAEQKLFEYFTPPEKTLELFEKYLPYAIALKVDNAWAKKFDNIMQQAIEGGYQPSYYSGSSYNMGRDFNMGDMSRSMSAGLSSTVASASTPPSSSSGGSGGGGSSGGGGGGGGGGGW